MDKIDNMLTAQSDKKLMNITMATMAIAAMASGIIGLVILFW